MVYGDGFNIEEDSFGSRGVSQTIEVSRRPVKVEQTSKPTQIQTQEYYAEVTQLEYLTKEDSSESYSIVRVTESDPNRGTRITMLDSREEEPTQEVKKYYIGNTITLHLRAGKTIEGRLTGINTAEPIIKVDGKEIFLSRLKGHVNYQKEGFDRLYLEVVDN